MGFRDSVQGSNTESLMSALGQKRTLKRRLLMSALPPKADIRWRYSDVRFVPGADSCTAAKSATEAEASRWIKNMTWRRGSVPAVRSREPFG
jgi:hypothetical protein